MSGREPWRLLTTWNAEPGFNMALDEALLLAQEPRPTLRFYTWEPDALSLGYFQRWAEVPLPPPPTVLVRRMTGGGAIHHKDELTFSIAAALGHPLYRGPIADSYVRIHSAIAEALRALGVDACLRADRRLASDKSSSAMCFHHSTRLDVVWNDRKGVGSAQRRKGGRVLHHGSIKLGTTPLEGEIATLRPLDPSADAEPLAGRLLETFERRFEARFELEAPGEEELARAAERAGHFFGDAFLRRR